MAEKYELNDLLVSKFIDLFCYDSEAEEWMTKWNSVEQEVLGRTMKTVSIDFSGGDYTRNLTVSLPDELLGEKVNESNAIYFMGKSVENNATQKPSSFVRNWRLIKIDLDGLHRPSSMMICLSGKSFSDVFVVSDFEAKDFDLEWNAIKSRDVKSRISEYRPQCT